MVDAAVSKTVEVTLVRVRLSPSAPALFIPEKRFMHSNYQLDDISVILVNTQLLYVAVPV